MANRKQLTNYENECGIRWCKKTLSKFIPDSEILIGNSARDLALCCQFRRSIYDKLYGTSGFEMLSSFWISLLQVEVCPQCGIKER